MTIADMTPDQARQALAEDPQLKVLDVRTNMEFDGGHIDNAQLIPVQELEGRIGELDPAAKYLVICGHGVRSVAACQILASRGFGNLTNILGGMAAW